MNSGASAPATPKPPPPKTDKAAPTKVTIADPVGAIAKRDGKETRYIIGRKLAGDAKGNSAFALSDKYTPDLDKLPAAGNATLTLDDTGRVVGIGVVATL